MKPAQNVEAELRSKFETFLSSRTEAGGTRPITNREREELFKEFQQWQRR
jgi:hypothetical protein